MNKKTILLAVFSLQEAFISLFPYLLLRASFTLLVIFNEYAMLVNHSFLLRMEGLIYDVFPLLLCLSISTHIAKNYFLSKTNFILSSLFLFVVSSGVFQYYDGNILLISKGSLFYAFIIPLALSFFIYMAKKIFSALILQFSGRSSTFNEAINYLPLYFFIPFISLIKQESFLYFPRPVFLIFSNLSIEIQAIIHLLTSHLLWLLGIHGTTTYRYLFDMGFYTQTIFGDLPYENFFSAFVVFGGAGSTLSLIIAILISSKDKHSRIVAKSSIPFSIFNINEVLIYGLPIALNKNYILPFIFIPLFNFTLSFILIKNDLLTFSYVAIPWTTPPLLSGYLLTNSIFGSLWQLMLIVLGVVIYRPFCERASNWKNSINEIQKQLSRDGLPDYEVNHFDAFERHQQITKDMDHIDVDLKNMLSGELTIHYQPQINLIDNTVYGYEALIRLVKDKQVYPPIFLPSIEKAGLESYLDEWVFRKVKNDIDEWHTCSDENPLISINIYPKTLLNQQKIDLFIDLFTGYRIKIEILERGFSTDFIKINKALKQLLEAGFEVAVDDFGSDQANLSLLGEISANSIKLDRSLLLHCENEKGLILFNSSCATFKNMGFHIVSEGVETFEQLEIVKKCKVNVVQGWFFSKAIPLNLAIKYQGGPSTKEAPRGQPA